MAGIPLSAMEHPHPRLWGSIPRVKGESKTEIPVETSCINNEDEVAKSKQFVEPFEARKGTPYDGRGRQGSSPKVSVSGRNAL
jgi:hypothetical protein